MKWLWSFEEWLQIQMSNFFQYHALDQGSVFKSFEVLIKLNDFIV